ncbi:MAG: hypothetical protein ACYC3F_16700 [Gemmatimonadaceae bacterium]
MSNYFIQSVIIPRKGYSLKAAKAWIKAHGYLARFPGKRGPQPDITANYYRFRQGRPDVPEAEKITQELPNSGGIKLIIYYVKGN